MTEEKEKEGVKCQHRHLHGQGNGFFTCFSCYKLLTADEALEAWGYQKQDKK